MNFKVELYKKANGNVPVAEYIVKLNESGQKAEAEGVRLYIRLFEEYGPEINKYYSRDATDKLDDEIFELRPKNTRILFFYKENGAVLLHCFRKKSRKTPPSEIKNAKNEMKDYKRRI